YFRSTSRYGRINWSLMNSQMILVISSPSSSTTGPTTLILGMLLLSLSCLGSRSRSSAVVTADSVRRALRPAVLRKAHWRGYPSPPRGLDLACHFRATAD